MGTYLAKPNTEKQIKSAVASKLSFTSCQMQGWRRQMEDALICDSDLGDGNSLFAVFDGHGGPEISNYVKVIFKETLMKSEFYQKGQYDKAMIQTFKVVDEKLRTDQAQKDLCQLSKLRKDKTIMRYIRNKKISEIAGCAANVLLITPLVYVVANCGDSRSVLCRKGKAIQMSFDHKPDGPTEIDRIKSAGGRVISGRINGGLNLSRGFGDYNYKNQQLNFDQRMITCMPEIRFFARSPDDDFILVGCDGIFENYTYDVQPLANIISKGIKSRKKGQTILPQLFDRLIAKQLNCVEGCDNMSSILINFR